MKSQSSGPLRTGTPRTPRRRVSARKAPRNPRPTRIHPTNPSSTTMLSAAVAWDRRLARDADSLDLENLPFALTVSTILIAGLCAMGWGVTVSSAWLTVLGILIALVGCVLYGWSLYDE